MGSPSMNLFDGVVVREGEQWRLKVGGSATGRLELPLSGEWVGALGELEGEEATIGIRPEDVLLREPGGEDASRAMALTGEVVLVEALGDSALVTLRLGESEKSLGDKQAPLVIAKINRDQRVQTGERKLVIVDDSRLHLFAGKDQVRMKLSGDL
jgi:ABC-type sugar transport system ATPase subunit